MYVSMKNEFGHIRRVKVGPAWMPLLFGGIPFFFRGMFLKGLLWTILSYTLLVPAIYLIFAMNRMTAKHWLNRGYVPVGDGWDYARMKWGSTVPAVPAASVAVAAAAFALASLLPLSTPVKAQSRDGIMLVAGAAAVYEQTAGRCHYEPVVGEALDAISAQLAKTNPVLWQRAKQQAASAPQAAMGLATIQGATSSDYCRLMGHGVGNGLPFALIMSGVPSPELMMEMDRLSNGGGRDRADAQTASKPTTPTEKLPADHPHSPDRVIKLWEEQERECRGGSGDMPETHAACAARDAYVSMLNEAGACRGKKEQHSYEYEWHRCGTDSLR